MTSSKTTLWVIGALAAILVAGGSVQANPTIYTGELSVGSGLIATGEWNNANTTLSWVVDDETTPGMWHYEYTLTVADDPGISHIIVEVSDSFTVRNLFRLDR